MRQKYVTTPRTPEEFRRDYFTRNAYLPWSKEEDAALRGLTLDGLMPALALVFGRTSGAIWSRLSNHLLTKYEYEQFKKKVRRLRC